MSQELSDNALMQPKKMNSREEGEHTQVDTRYCQLQPEVFVHHNDVMKSFIIGNHPTRACS